MQTSKLLLVICAFTLLVGVLYPRADETEAQKRAREALRQKMLETEGQPQPATPQRQPPHTARSGSAADSCTSGDPSSRTSCCAGRSAVRTMRRKPGRAWRCARRWAKAGRDATRFCCFVDACGNGERRPGPRAGSALAGNEGIRCAAISHSRYDCVPTHGASTGSGFRPKAGRLAELLSRYRVDLITPEDYHKQRASILAEP